jgi:hypothetical protein
MGSVSDQKKTGRICIGQKPEDIGVRLKASPKKVVTFLGCSMWKVR